MPDDRFAVLRAVRDLHARALRPGADVPAILRELDERAAWTHEEDVRARARAAIEHIVRFVPPPRRPAPPVPEVARLWGLPDSLDFDPAVRWSGPADGLRVPVGAGLVVDAAQHTLVVGPTGSGKTELLRTVILGLAATHGPGEVNVLPVDLMTVYGWEEFLPLPHLAGLATWLEDRDEHRRLVDAIHAELVRRQERLRDAGHPGPHLVIAVDDVGELVTIVPEAIELLVMIGRIGRSVGVHLLLAAQRYEPGRLRGLPGHLGATIELPRPFACVSGEHLGAAPAWPEILRPPTLLEALVRRISAHGDLARQVWPPA